MSRRKKPEQNDDLDISELDNPGLPPALTQEEREKQMIALAYTQAEKDLMAGKASQSVVLHFLKMGSSRETLEQEKLSKENVLYTAKTEAIRDSKKTEMMYRDAIDAMRLYQGVSSMQQPPVTWSDEE